MATNFIILPFVTAKRGNKLVAGTPQRAKDEPKAMAAAQRMAGQYVGIVVLEEHSDPEQRRRSSCAPSATVPPEMIEALVA